MLQVTKSYCSYIWWELAECRQNIRRYLRSLWGLRGLGITLPWLGVKEGKELLNRWMLLGVVLRKGTNASITQNIASPPSW